MKRAIILLGAAALAACSGSPQQPSEAAASDAAKLAAATTAPATPGPTPALTATPPSESRDPATVVVAWAKAMTLKQWDSAYLYWGDHGARSGLTLPQFAAKWGKLSNPEFELHKGETEGAAGSSYYTAPIVLIDGKRHLRGEIVLRRVNDVDGASPEQLRWHIESLTTEP